MLVDNEHQCQLFYRSLPLPHLLSSTFLWACPEHGPVRHERPRIVRPVAFEVRSPRAAPARGIRRRFTSRTPQAGLAVPAESGPAAILAASSASRPRVYEAELTGSSVGPAASRPVGSRPQHERLDCYQVVEHGLARGRAVAPRDGLHDPPVVLMRAGRSPGRVDGLFAALREQI